MTKILFIIIMFVIMIIFLIVDINMKIMNQVIGSLVPLGLICLIVTFGNLLVISAVRYRSSLGIIIARYFYRQVLSLSGIIIVRYCHLPSGIIIIVIAAFRYQ